MCPTTSQCIARVSSHHVNLEVVQECAHRSSWTAVPSCCRSRITAVGRKKGSGGGGGGGVNDRSRGHGRAACLTGYVANNKRMESAWPLPQFNA